MSPFPLIWRKISVHVELRGVVDGCNRLKSNPYTLLLEGPEVGPRDCSSRGRFCSSRFPAIRVSTVMEIVYPCIPDPNGEDEGGQPSSSLVVSTRWISIAKLLQYDLATLAQRERGE
ncbi:hypothetical protein GW17_00062194 [Ensete ventricosum]|nr:hypothetical protein GW17_00062194 [Ensete ventricosum]